MEHVPVESFDDPVRPEPDVRSRSLSTAHIHRSPNLGIQIENIYTQSKNQNSGHRINLSLYELSVQHWNRSIAWATLG